MTEVEARAPHCACQIANITITNIVDGEGHLPVSLLLSSPVCHLRAQQDQEHFVEICEAFPTMGNGELNMPKSKLWRIPHFEQKSKKGTPGKEKTRPRSTPTPAGSGESSKQRKLQETARRGVDFGSNYLEDNSKPSP